MLLGKNTCRTETSVVLKLVNCTKGHIICTVEPKQVLYWNIRLSSFLLSSVLVEPKQVLYWNVRYLKNDYTWIYVEPKQVLYWNHHMNGQYIFTDTVEPKQVLYWNGVTDFFDSFKSESNRNKCCIEIKMFWFKELAQL